MEVKHICIHGWSGFESDTVLSPTDPCQDCIPIQPRTPPKLSTAFANRLSHRVPQLWNIEALHQNNQSTITSSLCFFRSAQWLASRVARPRSRPRRPQTRKERMFSRQWSVPLLLELSLFIICSHAPIGSRRLLPGPIPALQPRASKGALRSALRPASSAPTETDPR